METNGALKIIGLRVDGIRKLNAVEMEFEDSGLIQIKGKNDQGKTSLINTIEWLIEGNKVLNKEIINHNKEHAEAGLRVGKYQIKRVAGKGAKLEVRNTETNTIERGEVQNFLDTFINELTFNPRPFLDQTPYQQLKFCMELFGIDFSEIDKQMETLENDRLLKGREIKRFGAIIFPEKAETVDIDDLIKERKEINNRNNTETAEHQRAVTNELAMLEVFNKEQRDKAQLIKSFQASVDLAEANAKRAEEDFVNAAIELENAKTKANSENNILNAQTIKLAGMDQPEPEVPLTSIIEKPELESTDTVDLKISKTGATNVKAAAYEKALEDRLTKELCEKEYMEYQEQIDELREEKLEILRKVKTGVDGFEIKIEGIYYNGVSSENWSDSDGLVLASKLCLAQMPKLRAIFMDRGESLDEDTLKAWGEWAKANDIQAFITIVDSIPEQLEDGVFYIEEGRVTVADCKSTEE